MKLVLSITLLLVVSLSDAQRTIDVNKVEVTPNRGLYYVVGGQPFSLAKYTKVTEGTPFFNDKWMSGSVIVKSGEQYDNQLLRLDLMDNQLHYLDSVGTEMITTEKVVEVLLSDTISGKQYHFVYSTAIAVPASERPGPGWYQLLSTGSANLFRLFQKELLESRPYGSATFEESIKTTSVFFVAYKNSFSRIKKIKDIPEILDNHKSELNNYISKNGLSGKTETDYISLLDYYNSIQTK
jgi:hypothetical protein